MTNTKAISVLPALAIAITAAGANANDLDRTFTNKRSQSIGNVACQATASLRVKLTGEADQHTSLSDARGSAFCAGVRLPGVRFRVDSATNPTGRSASVRAYINNAQVFSQFDSDDGPSGEAVVQTTPLAFSASAGEFRVPYTFPVPLVGGIRVSAKAKVRGTVDAEAFTQGYRGDSSSCASQEAQAKLGLDLRVTGSASTSVPFVGNFAASITGSGRLVELRPEVELSSCSDSRGRVTLRREARVGGTILGGTVTGRVKRNGSTLLQATLLDLDGFPFSFRLPL